MNKFCPAGKIECERIYNGRCGYWNEMLPSIGTELISFEQCPWPSRQQPIAPEPEKPRTINGLYIVDESPATEPAGDYFVVQAKALSKLIFAEYPSGWKYDISDMADFLKQIYARGRADFKRECVEAVKFYHICGESNYDREHELIDKIIAAIEAVK